MDPQQYDGMVKSRREAMLQSMRSRRQDYITTLDETKQKHKVAMKKFHENRKEEDRLSKIVTQRNEVKQQHVRTTLTTMMQSEINNFEGNLLALGLVVPKKSSKSAADGTAAVEEDEESQTESHVDPISNEISMNEAVIEAEAPSFDQYVKRMQDRRLEDMASRTRKAERRARTVLSESTVYRTMDLTRRQDTVKAKQEQPSYMEAQLLSALAQQSKWFSVIAANTNYRDSQRDRFKSSQTTSHRRRLEMLAKKAYDDYILAIEMERKKWHALGEEQKRQADEEHHDVCADAVDRLLSLVMLETEYTQRDFSCEKVMPLDKRIEARRLFLRSVDKMSVEEFDAPGAHTLAEAEELEEYIHLLGKWNGHGSQDAAHGVNPLGVNVARMLKNLTTIVHPPPVVPTPQLTADLIYIVTTGKKYTGKSLACAKIAKQLNLFLANDMNLVEDAVGTNWEEALDECGTNDSARAIVIQQVQLASRIRESLLRGECITEHDQIKLLILKMRSIEQKANEEGAYRGIVCDGVPCTADGFEYFRVNVRAAVLTETMKPVVEKHFYDSYIPSTVPKDPHADDVVDEPPPADAVEKQDTKKDVKPAAPKKSKGKDEVEEPLPAVDLPHVAEIPEFTPEQQSVLANGKYFEKYDAGVHLVLHFQCPSEVVFGRYAGIREDEETKEKYHVTFYPPPLERQEHIREVDRTSADSAQLHAKLRTIEVEEEKITAWFTKHPAVFMPIDAGSHNVEAVVGSAVAAASEAQSRVSTDYATAISAAGILESRSHAMQVHKEQAAAREEARKKLATIYKERGADLPHDLLDPPPTLRSLQNIEHAIGAPVATNLLNAYEVELNKYKDNIMRGVSFLSTLQYKLSSQWRTLLQNYALFLLRERPATNALSAFVEDFNQFDAELRLDEQAKDELHLRTDGLFEALRKEVDTRRDESNAHIEGFVKALFNDAWLESARTAIVYLMQLEIIRFIATVRFIASYYSEALGKEIRIDPIPITATIVNAARGTNDFCLLDHIHLNDPTAAPVPEPAASKDPKGAKKDTKPAPKAPPKRSQSITDADPEAKPDSLDIAATAALSYVTKVMALEDANTTVPEVVAKPGAKAVVQEKSEETKKNPVVDAAVKRALVQEGELLKERLHALKQKGQSTLSWGMGVASDSIGAMRKALQAQYQKEIHLVNVAVSFVRTAIEEERPLYHPIVMNDSTTYEDKTAPLLVQPPAVPVPRSPITTDNLDLVLPWMTKEQVMALITPWKAIAPYSGVGRSEFMAAMNIALATALKQNTPQPVKDFWTTFQSKFSLVFDAFVNMNTQLADWKSVVFHLLLWSEGEVLQDMSETHLADIFNSRISPHYIPSPQLSELVNLRQDIFQVCAQQQQLQGGEGSSEMAVVGRVPECMYLCKESFFQLPLWLERRLPEVSSRHIRNFLWAMFSQTCPKGLEEEVSKQMNSITSTTATAGSAAPLEVLHWPSLLLYLCVDEQHVRGVQKAFSVLSQPIDENSTLTQPEIWTLLHFTPPPPQQQPHDVGSDDIFGAHAIQLLFDDVTTLHRLESTIDSVTFGDTCAVHRGRVMWNHAKMFTRLGLDVKKMVYGLGDKDSDEDEGKKDGVSFLAPTKD